MNYRSGKAEKKKADKADVGTATMGSRKSPSAHRYQDVTKYLWTPSGRTISFRRHVTIFVAAMGRRPIGKVAMTSAERVRRHREKHGVTKTATKQGAAEAAALAVEVERLRAENAELRARREGLAIEALQAARARASIGVVGVGIEEQTATTEALQIARWFTEDERQAIKETWEGPFFDFDKDARAALKRLVTEDDERMRDLYKQLPEGAIGLAIHALGIFPLLRPPPTRKRAARKKWEQNLQRWEQHYFKLWVKHPHPTMGRNWGSLAGSACELRDVLARVRYVLGPRADEMLSRHLRRGPVFKDARFQPFLDEVDFAQEPAPMVAAISFLHVLYHGFLSIDEEHRLELKGHPRVARWDDPQAPRRFFIDYMSDRMKELCDGHPSIDLVAMLSAVAFGLDDVDPETLGRRRRKRAAQIERKLTP